MLEIRHQVPGRLRLHLPLLRTDSRLASALPDQLRRCDGVHAVRANPTCASVVIRHDPQRVSAEALQQRLQALLPASTPTAAVVVAGAAAGALLPKSQRQSQGGWWRLPTLMIRERFKRREPAQSLALSGPPAPGIVMLCRMNVRLSRWMMRQTLRCWWNGELGSVLSHSPHQCQSARPQRALGRLKTSLAGFPAGLRAEQRAP